MIAVKWDSILNNRSYIIDGTYNNDQPTANRLYRNHLGIDQDYYERMPLLVNALQESSYIDPSLDVIPATKVNKPNQTNTRPQISRNWKLNNIRKTSPKPFYYKTSTNLPFSKTYGSRNWIEKYRNAQRLQNIRQVIRYLEKSINSKTDETYRKKPNSQVAFSGIYVEPMLSENHDDPNIEFDLTPQGSMSTKGFSSNQYFTPLMNFMPDNPGEVNLLADTLLKFSPFPTARLRNITHRPIMFKRIANYNKKCNDINCKENSNNEKDVNRNMGKDNQDQFSTTTDKSFSVILNLFPLKSALNSDHRGRISTRNSQTSLDDIYFTTSRPIVKFKRKATTPTTRRYLRRKPRISMQNRINKQDKSNNLDISKNTKHTPDMRTKMVVRVQVFTPDVNTKAGTTTNTDLNTLKSVLTESPPVYLSVAPVQLSSNQVEDFHVGSSGVIPIIDTTTPVNVNITPTLMTIKSNTHRTSPSDILTFSHEDVKIPEQYKDNRDSEVVTDTIETTTKESVIEDGNEMIEMLVIKLKNIACNNTDTTETTTQENNGTEETTKPWIYVPQTNGHYRSQNPHAMDMHQLTETDHLTEEADDNISDRKPKYTTKYVEIKRNYSKKNKKVD